LRLLRRSHIAFACRIGSSPFNLQDNEALLALERTSGREKIEVAPNSLIDASSMQQLKFNQFHKWGICLGQLQ